MEIMLFHGCALVMQQFFTYSPWNKIVKWTYFWIDVHRISLLQGFRNFPPCSLSFNRVLCHTRQFALIILQNQPGSTCLAYRGPHSHTLWEFCSLDLVSILPYFVCSCLRVASNCLLMLLIEHCQPVWCWTRNQESWFKEPLRSGKSLLDGRGESLPEHLNYLEHSIRVTVDGNQLDNKEITLSQFYRYLGWMFLLMYCCI